MSFLDVDLKHSYETGVDDLISDFYIPMLSRAKRYDRIAGFFSSTSLALSAVGLAGLIERGGTMRLITCPRLSKEDADMINTAVGNPESILSKQLIRDMDDIEDQFQQDHIAALGWMLANGYLQLKIALVYNKGRLCNDDMTLSKAIMHQKVGVLYDEDFNGVSFSGSNNESVSGWLDNIEEFKVFKQWEAGQQVYFNGDQRRFSEFWENQRSNVKVVELPIAVKEHLIQAGSNFDVERIALHNYRSAKKKSEPVKKEKEKLRLFPIQEEAVAKWLACDKQILIEMATGTGKTRTAIGCMQKLLQTENKHVLVIISCPQNTLSVQWKKDIEKLETSVASCMFCDSTAHGWRNKLGIEIRKLSAGFYKNFVVYTTHQTCSSDDFCSIIRSSGSRIIKLFIGDEVHGLGALKTRRGLLDEYQYRIGLSATPARWFDEEGSALIQNYFGNNSYVFTIKDALKTINPLTGKPFLVNYRYHPHFIQLTDDELAEYKSLSDKITRMSRKTDDDAGARVLEFLLFKRADIEKNAENKYQELERILDSIGSDISDTIIFVSDEQLSRVLKILGDRGISAHRFTQQESTSPSSKYGGISEREYLIKKFVEGDYQVLVAIKCLDEGIDIPSAKRAIVMASSTNPREYVQRIGRIIRQAPNKTVAELYDLIIHPDTSGFKEDELAKLELRIFRKEMDRVLELSENANNNAEVTNRVYKILGGLV